MSTPSTSRRRDFFTTATAVGATLVVGCTPDARAPATPARLTPNEDLMQEHGVLTRVIALWQHTDTQLREGQLASADALRRSITLVQELIQEHHERTEEAHVFPVLERAGRELALVRTLRDQHVLGRAATHESVELLSGALDPTSRLRVATLLEGLGRMMTAHVSREDTIVFPAFRSLLGARYADFGAEMEPDEEPEEVEHELAEAAEQLEELETALGVGDLRSWSIDAA